MVIAIPLCAALKGIFVYYFENETGRQLVAYDGAVFKGTPYRDTEGNPVAAYDALDDDTFIYESELIGNETAPEAKAMPKPELDNPWIKLSGLQPDATVSLRTPLPRTTTQALTTTPKPASTAPWTIRIPNRPC